MARYLSGEATPAESALVHAWARDPQARKELQAMQRAWSHSFPLERSIDTDAAWQNMAAAMHAEHQAHDQGFPRAAEGHGNLRLEPPISSARTVERRVHMLRPALDRAARAAYTRRVATMAAAAAVLVATGITLVRGSWPAAFDAKAGAVAVASTTRDFTARPGQRAFIDLADGTHIVLAPASRLHVSLPTGAHGTRELTLDGEAMFTVTHDSARPFVVHSRYGTTVDIGTSFAVRAYAGQQYRVVVRDGRVALGGTGAPVLVAGDVASRAEDGTVHVLHGQDAGALLDWTTGRLSFQHTRFADLVPDLERWYGVTIRITTPELRDRIITGQLDTESRSEAMNAIGRTLGAQHTTHGSRVTFSLRGDAR